MNHDIYNSPFTLLCKPELLESSWSHIPPEFHPKSKTYELSRSSQNKTNPAPFCTDWLNRLLNVLIEVNETFCCYRSNSCSAN